MLFDQRLKTTSFVNATVNVLTAGCFLRNACEPLAFGLFDNALMQNSNVLCRHRVLNFAVSPRQHIGTQTLDIFGGDGEIFVFPVRVLGANGGVVIGARFEIPLAPFAAAFRRHEMNLRIGIEY